ncbi:MAG: 3-dehydroquinate synthase [Acidobacteriaceae bacterium]
MPNSFEVESSSGKYGVTVGTGLFQSAAWAHPDAIYLVDEFLAPSLGVAEDRLISLVATEQQKSLEYMPHTFERLRELGANRSTYLIAVGGGVIQDIATLVASLYMRGLPWSYLPTTLLGMVDSCIGGKSSINVAGYKNLIGNFYPPKDIFVDVEFSRTLSREQIVGGLMEAAKICYARGQGNFEAYLAESPSSSMNPQQVEAVALRTLSTKKWFIEIDEFDQKERLLLNFGHTFGHAIEAGTGFGVSHGVAVGIGMMVAVEVALSRSWLSPTGQRNALALVQHVKDMLGAIAGEIQRPNSLDLDKVLEKFGSDKKHRSDRFRIVSPIADGGLELVPMDKDATSRRDILCAFRNAFAQIGWSDLVVQA